MVVWRAQCRLAQRAFAQGNAARLLGTACCQNPVQGGVRLQVAHSEVWNGESVRAFAFGVAELRNSRGGRRRSRGIQPHTP